MSIVPKLNNYYSKKLAKSTVLKRDYTLDRIKMELGKVYARDIKTIYITRYLNRMCNPQTGEGTASSPDLYRDLLT